MIIPAIALKSLSFDCCHQQLRSERKLEKNSPECFIGTLGLGSTYQTAEFCTQEAFI